MVPNKTSHIEILYKSTLKTLSNIVLELLNIANNKKKIILEQNWQELQELSDRQIIINKHLDELINRLDKDYFNLYKNEKNNNLDNEIKELKNKIKKRLIEYKEIENLNKKLLNDCFFVVKQKAEKYFSSISNNDQTYTKDMNKEKIIWQNKPIILDRTI